MTRKHICEAPERLNSRISLYGRIVCSAAIVVTLLVGTVTAQDLDPRRYVNLSTGQNFLAGIYSYSEGDANMSPSLTLEDAFLRVDGPTVTYLRTIDIGGKTSSLDVYLPYVCASGSAVLDGERLNRSVCGQGDTSIRISPNFTGAPAMELSEFERKKKELVGRC